MSRENAAEAYQSLLATLDEIGASSLVRDITAAVGIGTVEEAADDRGRSYPKRRPLRPVESYLLAVRMVVASVDPLIMRGEVEAKLTEISSDVKEIAWAPDYLEESTRSISDYEQINWPQIEGDTFDRIRHFAEKVAYELDSWAEVYTDGAS